MPVYVYSGPASVRGGKHFSTKVTLSILVSTWLIVFLGLKNELGIGLLVICPDTFASGGDLIALAPKS